MRLDGKPLLAVFDLVTAYGGTQTVMAQLLPRLMEDFRVVVLDPYANADYARMLDAAGVERASLGSAPASPFVGGDGALGRALNLAARAPWLLATGLSLRRWTEENKPAVVYFNQAPAARFFAPFLPSSGPALVYHAHGSVSDADARHAKFLGRRFDRILAVSARTRERLVAAGADAAKTAVVYNAVDGEAVRRASASGKSALPSRAPGEIVVALVGALIENKRQDLAVEALAQLPANVSLWLCGDVPGGADRGYAERLTARVSELGLGARVRLLGWRDDVPFVLAGADIGLLPSKTDSESFGMALAEAMALGKPCVGTPVGGIPEVIDDSKTGFVAAGTADALAGALRKLVDSAELRAEMGKAGREKVAREFALDRQVRQVREQLALAARTRA